MGAGEGAGDGGGGSKWCPGLIWAIIWFLILWFLAWPIAFFIAWLYVLLLPFGVCIPAVKDAADAVFKVVTLPVTVTENMIAMKPLCG